MLTSDPQSMVPNVRDTNMIIIGASWKVDI